MKKYYSAPDMEIRKYSLLDSNYAITTSFTGNGEDKDLNTDDTVDYFGNN